MRKECPPERKCQWLRAARRRSQARLKELSMSAGAASRSKIRGRAPAERAVAYRLEAPAARSFESGLCRFGMVPSTRSSVALLQPKSGRAADADNSAYPRLINVSLVAAVRGFNLLVNVLLDELVPRAAVTGALR